MVTAEMGFEFHPVDRRYEPLRPRCRERERRVLTSVARDGQTLPQLAVVADEEAGFRASRAREGGP